MNSVETNPIEAKLKAELAATHFELIDNSWRHAGHAGNTGGSHLALIIASPQFEGLGIMERHRTVHKLLKDEMATQIHALELKLYTPEEWEKHSQSTTAIR